MQTSDNGPRAPHHRELLTAAQDWRLTPATMAHHLSKGFWKPARHLLYISSIIASAIYRGITTGQGAYVMISVPPRHGKSELVSIWTPIWILDHFPNLNVLLTTYGADLSTDFSRAARDRALENANLLRFSVHPEARHVARWRTTQTGGMYAVGIGGAITGRGAHVIIVDDYIKNSEEALNKAHRDKVYDYFRSTILTRRHKGAVVVIVATRWDVDDLIGRLLKDKTLPWQYINLRAMIETQEQAEGDPLGRHLGDPLWPDMYDADFLLQTKASIGDYWWSALYQQEPYEATSGVCSESWFRVVDSLPRPLPGWAMRRVWDLSAGADDYSAGTLIGFDSDSGLYYIIDVVRVRKAPAELEQMVRRTAEADTPEVPVVIEQEPGSSGQALVNHYARNVLRGFSVKAHRPTGPKWVRAQPLMAAASSGIVRLVKGPWNEEFLKEISTFPDGPHDDQVDSAAMAYNELAVHSRFVSPVWGRRPSQAIEGKKPHDMSGGAKSTGNIITGVVFGRRRSRRL